jgi:hypothetical protein
MVGLFFLLFIGLELKHFIADYFMQPGWMLAGKGNFRRSGGYAHAGVHAALTAVVLVLAGTPLAWLVGIIAGEFVVHYLLDYGKIQYSRGVHVDSQPARFWSLHGLDQIGHQLTYAAIIYAVLVAKGMA